MQSKKKKRTKKKTKVNKMNIKLIKLFCLQSTDSAQLVCGRHSGQFGAGRGREKDQAGE